MALSLLAVAVIWVTVGLLVWRDRADSLASATLLTHSLTRVAAERVEGALDSVDLVLADVAARLRLSGGKDGEALTAFMRSRTQTSANLRTVFVLNAQGMTILSTHPGLMGVNLAERGYVAQVKAGKADGQMVISGPIVSAATGRIGIVAARPIRNDRGDYEGLVAAVLNPEFFAQTLSGVTSDDADRSIIATLDGEVLARLPESPANASIKSGPLFTEYLPKAREGDFIAESKFDGQRRLASYLVLERFPVVVSVGVTVKAALRRWSFATASTAAAGLVFTALVLIVASLAERRRAALAASEERYRGLVEGQRDLICRFLPDTTLLAFNAPYAAFFGLSPDELAGRRWMDLIPEAERAEMASLLDSFSPANPAHQDHRRVTPPGKPDRWIEWRTTAEFDERGAVLGFQSIGRDVTDSHLAQQAMEEREELYRQIFHRNPAVKLLVDPSTAMIVDANQSAARFYGYPVDALKRMRISEINILPADQVKAELEAVEREDRPFLRHKHRLASGEVRDVEVYSSPLHANGRSYLSSIVVDVTERNRFEAELAAKSADLARSNAELEQFAYVASHDLRQPLRTVSSYATLLGRSLGDALTDDQREFLGFLTSGVRRMDALILGLLEYSRVGRGGTAPQAVDCDGVLAEAAANLGLGADGEDERLKVAGPLPTVFGVRPELVRLFQNLLGNALKYRHPEREPRLTLSCARQGDEWVFRFEDNGIGIEQKNFERVFMLFQRLHGSTEIEGDGIGLTICQKIVRTHGGRIWVESEFGQGSRFFVALPVQAG